MQVLYGLCLCVPRSPWVGLSTSPVVNCCHQQLSDPILCGAIFYCCFLLPGTAVRPGPRPHSLCKTLSIDTLQPALTGAVARHNQLCGTQNFPPVFHDEARGRKASDLQHPTVYLYSSPLLLLLLLLLLLFFFSEQRYTPTRLTSEG